MTTAVLFSSGLDSAVLGVAEARTSTVHPVYVSSGLAWELEELAAVERLLAIPVYRELKPLARLTFTVADLYPPTHWALRGTPPAFDTPDEDVYLTGRNLVLLTKAGVVAARHGAHRIALGPLAGNPFPDARPAFFAAMAQALSLGLDHQIDVVTPFLEWEKADVIKRGVELGVPLELTLSCMNPPSLANNPSSFGGTGLEGAAWHCGLCSKCRERRDAFADAGVSDPSRYAKPSPR